MPMTKPKPKPKPTPPPPDESKPLTRAREAFGRTLTHWLDRAGWAHDLPMRWGKQAGFSAVADSTFNRLQRGQIQQPYPITFLQFCEINRRLAEGDFGITDDPQLLARLGRQKPICHEDGSPWIASDFFAHFIGELDAPPWAQEQEPPSLAEAVAAGDVAAETFRTIAEQHGMKLAVAWESLQALASKPPRRLDHRQVLELRNVLSGWNTWTPEQLGALLDPDGDNRAQLLLEDWRGSLQEPS
jgi:hypothetical protein